MHSEHTLASPPADTGEQTILLHAEQARIDRRMVDTAHVRVSTKTVHEDFHVDTELAQDDAVIERVAIGRIVAEMPQIRVEGDVVVMPVVEEIIVVEKRLLLKEEVHIRRVTTTRRHEETVTLRRQEAVIEREAATVETGLTADAASGAATPSK